MYIYICVCVCVPIRMLKINSNHAEISGCLEFSGLRSSTIALQSPSLQLAGRWAWRLQLAHLQLEEGHIQRFRKTGPVGPCTIHFSYLFLLIRMYLPNCRVFFWVSFFNGPLFWSHCYTYTLHLSHPFFLWKANYSALTIFFSNTFRLRLGDVSGVEPHPNYLAHTISAVSMADSVPILIFRCRSDWIFEILDDIRTYPLLAATHCALALFDLASAMCMGYNQAITPTGVMGNQSPPKVIPPMNKGLLRA